MSPNIEYLYQRFNNFIGNGIPIQSANVLLKCFLEGNKSCDELERKVLSYEMTKSVSDKKPTKLLLDKNFVQPKSIFIKLDYVRLITDSLPESFFAQIGITSKTIVQITVAIVLYYILLQTKKNGYKEPTDSENRYLFGREDFLIDVDAINKVCGSVKKDDFDKYIELFAVPIERITDESRERLYLYNGIAFILSIDEFIDYIEFKTEDIFRKDSTDKQISESTLKKGFGFEEIVCEALEEFYPEVYHRMYYYPNENTRTELDVVIRNDDRIVVLECKAGTLDLSSLNDDDSVILKIRNVTKKGFSSLHNVGEYLRSTPEYEISSKDKATIISGKCNNPLLICVSMYSMDFISSNIHTMFPEYLQNRDNPILIISFEHFFAILLDSLLNKRDVWDYFEKRKEYIKEHPQMQFEINELDYYYEIINEKSQSMLGEIRRTGILDAVAPNARIEGIYHNSSGEEFRPANNYLEKVDEKLLLNILEKGKTWFGLNKRYLKFFKSFITIDDWQN